jgi:hypothetical protein
MADRKISDLTALTTPASGDYLPIVDISEASAANKNKRITIEELLRGAPDGTAAAPGIAFESDPNTGIYSPGADAFGVVTAGTERLRITSDGKVGLGTSSAGDILHVKGGSTYAGVIADNSATTGGGAFRAYRNGVQKAIFCADSWVTGTSSDDAAIYADAGGGIKFYTNNSSTAKAVLTSGGSLGIGTTSPSAILDVKVASDAKLLVQDGNTTGNVKFNAVNNAVSANVNLEISASNTQFFNGGSERARIDSSGRLLVGTSSARTVMSYQPLLQVEGTGAGAFLSVTNKNSADESPAIVLAKTRNGSIVSSGDTVGAIYFAADDGVDINQSAAWILAQVDGTPGSNDMPGRLVFSVTADGASSPTEAMRIKNTRVINFSNAPVYADNAAAKTGGLVDGDVYRTSTGDLKIVYT